MSDSTTTTTTTDETTENTSTTTTKTAAEINAENLDKANTIYKLLVEAGYSAEDLAMTDFYLNPFKPAVAPVVPPVPVCPVPPAPPAPAKCDVAEYTQPKPVVHPHDHREHDHKSFVPPCPMPAPFPPAPMPPAPAPYRPFQPYRPQGGGAVCPPSPALVAQADWEETRNWSPSYILNKPDVVLTINDDIKADENGNLELDAEGIGMAALTNEELSSLVNQVYHIFDTSTSSSGCNCNC